MAAHSERRPNGRGRYTRWSSPEVRDGPQRRYVEEQQSLRQVATALGCSYGTVHLTLTGAGVPLRPRGGTPRRTTEPSNGARDNPGIDEAALAAAGAAR